MNKTPNNQDFEELAQLYVESRSVEKKVKDKASLDYSRAVADQYHDKDDKDEEEEEEEETVKEGLLDRVSARVGAARDGLKGGAKAFMTGKSSGGGFQGKYEDGKTQRILQSHLNKVHSVLSGLASDVVKLGLLSKDEAENLATDAYQKIQSSFVSNNKGRGFQRKDFKK